MLEMGTNRISSIKSIIDFAYIPVFNQLSKNKNNPLWAITQRKTSYKKITIFKKPFSNTSNKEKEAENLSQKN